MTACCEDIDFLEHFSDPEDPRQAGKVLYPLDEILLLALLAVLGGAEGWVDVAYFGRRKLDFLRRFLPYKDGTPSHDQLPERGCSQKLGKSMRPCIR